MAAGMKDLSRFTLGGGRSCGVDSGAHVDRVRPADPKRQAEHGVPPAGL